MTIDLPLLFLAALAYLSVLFLVALLADRGHLPPWISHHPLTYVLSLGVYATTWSYYGSVGFAASQGYNYLTIYLGVTIAFLLAPVLLMPLLRLVREYQLTSLADLFAFRFRSHTAGILVTVFMLVGTLPYLALQIRAVAGSAQVLTQQTSPQLIALGFCVTVSLFAMLFGARHISPREKHEGLVVAIAFESLVKLLALLAVGLFAVFGVFGSPVGLSNWLDTHPEALQRLYEPVREGPWLTLTFLAFGAAFLLPRQFHMAFAENLNPRALNIASWGFPLYLLLLNLAIPPILWAGNHLQLSTGADFYVLGITLQGAPSWLPVLVFIGGISAASAMMIVTTLALSSMCLNHLLLPARYPDIQVDLYRWLLWGRRILIGVIVGAGYAFFNILEQRQGLVQLGLISFIAIIQFLPGVIGVLYWPRATRWGFIAGLLGGMAVWAATLLVPLLARAGLTESHPEVDALQAASSMDQWGFATFLSLLVNGGAFALISLLTKQSPEERQAAGACCSEGLQLPRGTVSAVSAAQFESHLGGVLGKDAAATEVSRALDDLGLSYDESRPSELHRLRERLERNLSGLIGPQLAHIIMEQPQGPAPAVHIALGDTVRYMEERLEVSRNRLQGLAGELDALRRYHRQMLMELPLPVCSLGADGEVVIWNLAMERLSGVPRRDAVGRNPRTLASPWGAVIAEFAERRDAHLHKYRMETADGIHWLNLHKAAIDLQRADSALVPAGQIIIIEDLTDLQNLEAELAHAERLASIGRLAAGVAHEVGNPVTGIACLAQNLRDEDDPQVIRDSIHQILEQTKRISNIVQSLMTFSHGGGQGGHNERLNLCTVVDEAIRLVGLGRSRREVGIRNLCSSALPMNGNRPQLIQVLVNLLNNALDASQPGDEVLIHGVHQERHLLLDVVDQGSGIPESLRKRVFEPFFTTKEPGAGTGLGLPIVYRIVHEHGGNIELESANPGVRVILRFPAAIEQPILESVEP
ncbi:MAG: PAS domain S-box protein [Chromatiales bacterium]|nr:PAS domain S-box protein [Chromatiales bacterium]